MADWQISPDKTDVTLAVRLRNAINGSPKTGLTITNLQIRYIRVESDNDVTISAWQSLTALTSLTDAHADNKGYEIGEGYYRIDVPDAVCASGANYASVLVRDSVNNNILVKDVEIQLAYSVSEKASKAASTMVLGTVDTAGFAPTITEFEADDITEATDNHYNNRIVVWTSGALSGQATDITDYTLTGGRGHFTVTAMTETPANNDTFIIV